MERYNICDTCQGDIVLDRNERTGEWYEFCPNCAVVAYLPEAIGTGGEDLPLTVLGRYLREKQADLPVGM